MKHESPQDRGKRMLRESGYHSDERQDENLIHKMVKTSALKRKRGGSVPGESSAIRPDRRMRAKAEKKPKIGAVNVIIGHRGDPAAAHQMGMQQGVEQGMRMGAALGARRAGMQMQRPPAMAPMGRPGMPPTMPGGPGVPAAGVPGGMMNRGGRVHVREHTRRRAGGSV